LAAGLKLPIGYLDKAIAGALALIIGVASLLAGTVDLLKDSMRLARGLGRYMSAEWRQFSAQWQQSSIESGRARIEWVSRSNIPARLDRLPWVNSVHTLLVIALGATWILDGFEVSLAFVLSPVLLESRVLHFDLEQAGLAGTIYLIGVAGGALMFGWLTDRFGRKTLFMWTLSVYFVATACLAVAVDFKLFALCRFLAGLGIGGEYAAINSTIQELIPARVRGRWDLIINGSFWIGAALGGASLIVLLDPNIIGPNFGISLFGTDIVGRELGWRIAVFIGALFALMMLGMRVWIPESPRWLMAQNRFAEANAIVERFERAAGCPLPLDLPAVPLPGKADMGLRDIWHDYRERILVAGSMMAAQAFFYNGIFFTFALVLRDFYGVHAEQVGWYLLAFAGGNFAGPLMLGSRFDTIGRRWMISFTYATSGALLALTGWLFALKAITDVGLTIAWTMTFFVASAAASAAYLTAGETFPQQIRARAIALFVAIGAFFGGLSPWYFSHLIETRAGVFQGYLVAAVMMMVAAGIAWAWGVDAEGKSLEVSGGTATEPRGTIIAV